MAHRAFVGPASSCPISWGGRAFYMHDGQSTTLHDAIVRHGGESAASRDAYMALDQVDQEALVAFLESL